MTLVEAPVALHGNPQAVGLIERDVRGVDGAAQQRGEDDVGQHTLVLHELAAVLGFLAALFGQRDVNPAGELICLVPFALTMSEQYQFVSHMP